jgi:hypothetical protein
MQHAIIEREKNETKKDISKTYSELKEFEGKQYTGIWTIIVNLNQVASQVLNQLAKLQTSGRVVFVFNELVLAPIVEVAVVVT